MKSSLTELSSCLKGRPFLTTLVLLLPWPVRVTTLGMLLLPLPWPVRILPWTVRVLQRSNLTGPLQARAGRNHYSLVMPDCCTYYNGHLIFFKLSSFIKMAIFVFLYNRLQNVDSSQIFLPGSLSPTICQLTEHYI